MPYAINLTPDPQTALAVERAYAQMTTLDVRDDDLVTQYGPCVTLLVVADTIHEDDIAELLQRLVPGLSALAVRLAEPCIAHGSPPTLGLAVAPTEQLLATHAALFNGLPEAAVHLHYRPAHWRPHLKLSNIRGNRAAAKALAAAVAWEPLAGTLDHLEVIQYPPVQPVWQALLKPGQPQALLKPL